MYRDLFKLSSDIFFILDKDMKFIDINDKFTEVLCYNLEDLKDKSFIDIVDASNIEQGKFSMEMLENKDNLIYTNVFRSICGSKVPVRFNIRVIDDKVIGIGKIVEDTTCDTSKTLNLLSFSQGEKERKILLEAIEQSYVIIVMTDLAGHILYVNPTFENITGYSYGEVIGKNPRILKSGLTDPKIYEKMWAAITKGEIWQGEQINRRKDGSLYYEESRITPIYDSNKELKYFLAIKHDISERKLLELKLKDNAMKDDLTNAYNRRYLFKQLSEIIETYEITKNTFSLAIIDIDHFKSINDQYGHQAGDYVLIELVRAIGSNIRSCDVLARYGGEEFILVFPNTEKEAAKMILDRILEKVRVKCFVYMDSCINITFSAGVSDVDDLDGENVEIEKLIEVSDERLYIAKKTGRNKIIY